MERVDGSGYKAQEQKPFHGQVSYPAPYDYFGLNQLRFNPVVLTPDLVMSALGH